MWTGISKAAVKSPPIIPNFIPDSTRNTLRGNPRLGKNAISTKNSNGGVFTLISLCTELAKSWLIKKKKRMPKQSRTAKMEIKDNGRIRIVPAGQVYIYS